MADNFNMKKFLAENKLGAYSKLKEEKFYAPSYVAKKYGSKAKEIEDNIEDEKDNNPNIWDLYTSLETEKETDEFVKGFMNEGEAAYEYEKGKAAGEKIEKEKLKEDSDENYDIFMDGVLDVLVKDKLITKADVDALNRGGADDLMDALHDEWEGFKNYEETGQAISRSDLNLAARAVAKKIGKLKEDLGQDRTDAEAEKMMDFLAEYEFAYHKIDGVCYRVDDEGNRTRVADHYCWYNETGKEKEEGYMGTQYDSSEDMAVDMVKKGITEKSTEEALSMDATERMDGLVPQMALKAVMSGTQAIIRDLKQEGFEDDEIFEFIVSKIKTLG